MDSSDAEHITNPYGNFLSDPSSVHKMPPVLQVPTPEDAEEKESKVKQDYINCLRKIEKLAASTPGKFILGEEIQLADCWLHACLEFSGIAFPDSKTLTDWTCEFVKCYEAEPRVAKYFKERKPYPVPV